MQYPIYVPSKGRSESASTPALLKEAGIVCTLVVEPHEAEQYVRSFPDTPVLVLNQSNQGIAYARNAILAHVRIGQGTWYWMIDDDIRHFYRLQQDVFIETDASVLENIESLFPWYPRLGQATIGRRNREKQKDPLTWNISCCGCVCNHAFRVGVYRDHLQEDTDMSLQVLSNGYQTVQFNHIVLSTPHRGHNTGGLQQVYKEKTNEAWSRNLVEAWGPDICRLKKTRNSIKVHVNWDYFMRGVEK